MTHLVSRQESERRGAAAAPQTPRSAPQGRLPSDRRFGCSIVSGSPCLRHRGTRRSTVDYTSRAARRGGRGLIAIVGSYLVPVAAWLRPEAFATLQHTIPVVAESRPGLPTSRTSANLDQPPPSAFSLADLDRPLRWAWMIASLALILFVGVGARRLIALRPALAAGERRRSKCSDLAHCGSAVVGVWAPSVVLPRMGTGRFLSMSVQ